MKAIILAGGLGTRLRPTTLNLPKQLIKLAGKSIVEHSIDKIKRAGFSDVGIVVSPNTESIYKDKLKHIQGLSFIIQEKPLGLAHAVLSAKGYLGNEDPFLTFLGDNIFEAEFPKVEELQEEFEAKIVLKSVEDPRSLGVAVVQDKKVVKLIEKPKDPPSNYGVCGMYLLKPSIWESINDLSPSARGEYEITDAIAGLIHRGNGVSYKIVDGYWYDAGSLSDLLKANQSLVKNGQVIQSNGSNIYKSSIGDNCNIVDCRITNSIVLDGTTIKYSEVEDSLIGENVVIQSSVRLKHAHIGSYSKIGV